MNKKRVLIVTLFLTFFVPAFAQILPQYGIKAKLDASSGVIEVDQKMVYVHNEPSAINEIFIVDWNHAYSSTESPLAKRLVEEYNRSFYLSKKSKRGKTIIESITVNGKEVNWNRLIEKLDQIRIELPRPLEANQALQIALKYRLKLPDSKFTGYGKMTNQSFALENTFLRIARRNKGHWVLISHLDLEDHPGVAGDYAIDFELPAGLKLHSNLNVKKALFVEKSARYSLQAKNQKQLQFFIGNSFGFTHFKFQDKKIISNLDNNDLSEAALRYSLMRLVDFLHKNIGEYPHDRILIAEEKYTKRPFYGLTLIPRFLKPFPRQLEFEVKALNAYLYHYLYETFELHPRKDFWLLGGLHSYLMMRYVQEHYPDKKLFDFILRQPLAHFFLNKYHFTELKFNDTFREFHEFILRKNLQQAPTTSKEDLIKFNEQIGSPSQMGLFFNYLVTNGKFDLREFLDDLKSRKTSGEDLKTAFYTSFKPEHTSFVKSFLNERSSLDFRFKSFKRSKDSVQFSVAEKNNRKAPFQLGWIKNDSLIHQQDYPITNYDVPIKLPKKGADFLVINPKAKLPEFNPRNNWKKINGTGFKPLQFSFVKDLENPRKNQLFYNPRVEFNVYDGLSLGVRINNKSVKTRPFVLTAEPFYATLEKSLVGSFASSYAKYNEHSVFYLRQLNFSGTSFHYDTHLRYTSLAASYNLFKRAKDLRYNRKEVLNLFWQFVHREQNNTRENNPNYNVTGLRYIISNKGALDHFTLNSRFEASDLFGKINFTTEYRHLLRSGRQWSIRFFAGKFLWRNNLTTTFFDYALDRPTDYLFQYNYLGRSETTGIYSQQFIPAEGGFKARFEQPYIDDLLLSLNGSIGLWKWIEVYGDIGYLQRKNGSNDLLYGSGIRLNLVPDFFELFFPLYNSNGWQIEGPAYHEKIRYVIVLDPQTLTQLFSRKWF